MSDSNEHELLIKTPKQLVYVVLASFLVPIFVIILLAYYVSSGDKPGAGSDAMTEESVAQRLKPVANVAFQDANAPRVLKTGSEVYSSACAACHTTGAAGAPMLGNEGQWAPRLEQGFDTLVSHAINGIGTMPAKGGNSKLDDIEVARAVAYMGQEVGADYKEPDPK
ncbi:MAG: c-type cytochrome [Limnobacter sp.]|nr:c-type cytochrome [Limnobacter sp.]